MALARSSAAEVEVEVAAALPDGSTKTVGMFLLSLLTVEAEAREPILRQAELVA
jgi:hypothetical protein